MMMMNQEVGINDKTVYCLISINREFINRYIKYYFKF